MVSEERDEHDVASIGIDTLVRRTRHDSYTSQSHQITVAKKKAAVSELEYYYCVDSVEVVLLKCMTHTT